MYLKAQEIGTYDNGHSRVGLDKIADVLELEPDIAEEYAISLQILELIHYDQQHKEISIA